MSEHKDDKRRRLDELTRDDERLTWADELFRRGLPDDALGAELARRGDHQKVDRWPTRGSDADT